MGIRSRKSLLAAAALALGVLGSGSAGAVPMLQLYIEGASYDAAKESWYYPGNEFRLWAIGNLTGPGGAGGLPITSVRLAAVYDDPGTPVTITITPTRIGGSDVGSYSGFSDPSTPGDPVLLGIVDDGSRPWIGGPHYLPNHGEYGAGRTWQEFLLSDFTTPDSQLGDFVNTFPVPGAQAAQIHAYDVRVEGAEAHFDLYGLVVNARGHTSYVFAPPSRDATDGPEARVLPVPATLALLGVGALALGALRRAAR